MAVMGQLHHMTSGEYERALGQASQLGEHAYIWGDRRARTNVLRPPYPSTAWARPSHQGSTRRPTAPEKLPEKRENSGKAPGTLPENSRNAP